MGQEDQVVGFVAAAAVLALIVIAARRGVRLRAGLRWLATVPEPRLVGAGLPRVALLVPAFEEQHRLPGLAERLATLSYPDHLLRIVFITADAETVRDGVRSTADVAVDAVRVINAARGSEVAEWCSYPGDEPSMASQLNYGLAWLGERGWEFGADAYVGVIPADAYLRRQVLAFVGEQVQEWFARTGRYPEALQQPATHLRTFDGVSGGPGGTLLRAAGVFQSVFALSVEMPRLRAVAGRGGQRDGRVLGWRRPYTPLSGHGLFLRADVLAGHRGFPVEPWCEDIALTFGHYCRGGDVLVVPSVEDNESPLSWSAYFRQSASWFTGASQFVRLLRFSRRAAPGAGMLVRVSVLLRRLGLSAAWLGGPVIWWAALVTLAVAVGLGAALVALVVWSAVMYWSQRPLWLVSRPSRKGSTVFVGVMAAQEIVASVVFAVFLAPLGPLISVVSRLLCLPVGKAKTPHDRLDVSAVGESTRDAEGRDINV